MPIVISSLGAVEEVNQAVHSYGGIVLHDIIHDRHASKAIRKGADGLIAVAAGAGGHAGTLSPFALVQEIRQWFDGPLLLSGAIATGGADPRGTGDGRRHGLYRLALHRHRQRRAPADDYKQMIVDIEGRRHRLFQPLHRRARQLPQGLDRRQPAWTPTTCRQSDPSKMNFGGAQIARPGSTSGAAARASARSATMVSTATLVDRLAAEYEAAKRKLAA